MSLLGGKHFVQTLLAQASFDIWQNSYHIWHIKAPTTFFCGPAVKFALAHRALRVSVLRWQQFVRVHNTIRIKNIFDFMHQTDGLLRLAIVQVVGPLKSDPMFSTYTSFVFSCKFHHKGVYQRVNFSLQFLIFVPRETDINMEISISDMTKSCGD